MLPLLYIKIQGVSYVWLFWWMNGWMVGCMVGWMIRWIVGWIFSWMFGLLDGWIVGWLDRRIVGQLDIWLVGRMLSCLYVTVQSHKRGRSNYPPYRLFFLISELGEFGHFWYPLQCISLSFYILPKLCFYVTAQLTQAWQVHLPSLPSIHPGFRAWGIWAILVCKFSEFRLTK